MQTITKDEKATLVNAAYILRRIGENDLGDDVSNIASETPVEQDS